MKTWKVGGVTMSSPLIVGSGVCKSPVSVGPYLSQDLPIGAIVTGSYTKASREGNPERPVEYWDAERNVGYNAYGMPNMGFEEAYMQLSKMNTGGRPIIFNFAGFSPKEFVEMVEYHMKHRKSAPQISAILANFGCPNAHDKKTMPIANDFDSLVETLEGWKGVFRGDQAPFPIWVTLSPYLTKGDLATFPPEIDTSSVPYVHDGYCERVANLIGTVRYRGIVSAVVNFNTIGNCIYREGGKPVTAPNGGKAGMSGSLLKQFSIRQNAVFRKLLPASIDTIGCGGILHGDDSADFLDKKVVSAVMLTSLPHWFGGEKVFPRLLEESDRLLTHFYA